MRIPNKNNGGAVKSSLITGVLVVSGFLWLLTTFIFYVLYGVQKGNDEKMMMYLGQKERIIEERNALEEKLITMQSLVGFFSAEKTRKRINTLESIATKIEVVINYFNEIQSKRNKYGLKSLKTIKEKEEGTVSSKTKDLKREDLSARISPINMEEIAETFTSRLVELQEENQRLDDFIAKIEKKNETSKLEYERLLRDLESKKSELNARKKDIENDNKKTLEKLAGQKTQEDESVAKALAEVQTEKNQLDQKKKDYESAKGEKEQQIRRLQAQKYGRKTYQVKTEMVSFDPRDEKIDGKVVFSDPRNQTVYIDLGKRQKVIRGLKFDVYRVAEKGFRIQKGRIEIRKVLDKVSVAAILSQKSTDPIVPGDFLVNPVFNRFQPVYFVLAGKFAFKDRIKRKIEEIGGIVESQVTAKTNLVVHGSQKTEESSPNYEAAIRFGVPIIKERLLQRYITD